MHLKMLSCCGADILGVSIFSQLRILAYIGETKCPLGVRSIEHKHEPSPVAIHARTTDITSLLMNPVS